MNRDDLWTGVKTGDRRVLGELLNSYRPMLRRYAVGLLGKRMARRADTSDLIQESLTRAYSRAHQFRGENQAEFFAWLKAIVRNEAIRLQRYHLTGKRNMNLDVSEQCVMAGDRTPNPLGEASDQESLICIAVALETLPCAEREAVRKRSLKSQSFEAIALEMNRSPSAVKALWTRGIKRLRNMLTADPSSTSC